MTKINLEEENQQEIEYPDNAGYPLLVNLLILIDNVSGTLSQLISCVPKIRIQCQGPRRTSRDSEIRALDHHRGFCRW